MIWFEALKLTYRKNEEAFQVIIGFVILVLMIMIPSAEFFLGPPAEGHGKWLIVALGNLIMNFIVIIILSGVIYLTQLFYVNMKKIVTDFKKSLEALTPVIEKEIYKDLK